MLLMHRSKSSSMSPTTSKDYSSKSQVTLLTTILICTVEKSPFTLDTEGGFVHFFKLSDEKKPYQTLSLANATITDSDDILFNKETGEMRSCFII